MSSESPVSPQRSADYRAPVGAGEIDDDWIRKQYPRIHRAAWLMTGRAAEAEDLAQETFVVALDRWDSFQGRSSASTWLYGILIRLVQRRGRTLSRLRRRLMQYAEDNGSTRQQISEADDPQTALARQQWQESIWADVAGLPTSQRIAVTLRFAEGMSYQQIGETVGCATGTAKSRVHHGVKRLRDRLSEQCDDRDWRLDHSTGPGTSRFREESNEPIRPTVNTASDL